MKNKHLKRIFFIASLIIIVLSCNYEPSKLRIGYKPIAVDLPIFAAVEEGYFKEQGFNVELVRFTSSNDQVNAATLGKIDVFEAATNVVFDVGFVSKIKHKLIITNPYSNEKGYISDYLLVSDTNKIKKIEDLKGEKIGVFPGSVIKMFCNLIFMKHGLNKDDYELIELQTKDWAIALKTGQIAALSALEPTASQIIKDKIAYPIVNGLYAELMPNVPLSGHWISEEFEKKYGEDVTKKIILAYNKSIDFIETNPEKAKKYIVKYANVREDVLSKVNLNKWKKHEELDYKEIQSFIDLLYENGAIQNKENINDYMCK
ncbi:MAG: ABC transporter substrate-binding protein [Bacteroidales bacterium]|nr:ABC transporter substrate-binding protein [Bacteroidales bacterium]